MKIRLILGARHIYRKLCSNKGQFESEYLMDDVFVSCACSLHDITFY